MCTKLQITQKVGSNLQRFLLRRTFIKGFNRGTEFWRALLVGTYYFVEFCEEEL